MPRCIRISDIKKEVEGEDFKTVSILNMKGTIEIEEGDFVCITGPSGSGKTTLLSILGLLDFDYQGEYELQCCGSSISFHDLKYEERSSECHYRRRSLGFIFQDIKIQSNRSALDNATSALRYQGVSKRERETLGRDSLQKLGIDSSRHNNLVSYFSGGQQQRVGIARAFANTPEIVFADEPTAHLDEELAHDIYKRLQKRCKEEGITTIVITHDQNLLQYANRVITLVQSDDGEGYDIRLLSVHNRTNSEHREKLSSTSPKKVYWGRLTFEMFQEVRTEFQPIKDICIYLCIGWFMRLMTRLSFFGNKSEHPLLRMLCRPRPPAHRYLSNIAAILTCTLLFATAFLFQVIHYGIQSYQDTIIKQQDYFRQVVVQSNTSQNQSSELNLDKINDYMAQKNIDTSSVVKLYQLGATVALEEDLRFVRFEKKWPSELEQKFRVSSIQSNQDLDDRLSMRLIAFHPSDSAAQDYSIPETNDLRVGSKENLPTIYIRNNKNEWINLGSFEEVPQKGSILNLVFESTPFLEHEPPRKSGPKRRCIQFEVAGYSKLKKPKLEFAQRLNQFGSLYYHAIVHTETQKKILDWKESPVDSDAQIPSNWICPNTQSLDTSTKYSVGERGLPPVPSAYRFTLQDPQEAKSFHEYLEQYAVSNEMNLTVISEKELIGLILQYKTLTQQIGYALSFIPIFLCGVFALLVVQTVMSRKRNDLLLYLVMGAPFGALKIQSALISFSIIVPSVVLGYFISRLLQGSLDLSNNIVEFPQELFSSIQQVTVPLESFAAITATSLIIGLIMSLLSVQSIIRTNPSNVFRGE